MFKRLRPVIRVLFTGLLLKVLGRFADLRRTRSGKLYIEGRVKNRESKHWTTLKKHGSLMRFKTETKR